MQGKILKNIRKIYANYKKTCIVFLIICVLAIPYSLLGFFGVPWVLKNIVPNFLSDKNATLKIEQVKFNPYKFELNATKVSLKTSSEIFNAKAIDVRLNFKRIFLKDINIEILSLKEPHINIQKEANATFNFDSLLASEQNSDKNENKESFFNITLDKFKIANGEARYIDNTPKKPFKISFSNLNYEIHDINLKANSIGRHYFDSNSSLIDSLDWNGRVRLDPLSIYGDISFNGLKLNKIWQSYMSDYDLNIKDGSLNAKLNYNIKVDDKNINVDINNSEISVKNFKISDLNETIEFDKMGINDMNLSSKFDENSSIGIILKAFNIKNLKFQTLSHNDKIGAFVDSINLKNSKFNIQNDTNSTNLFANLENIEITPISVEYKKEKLAQIDKINANSINLKDETLAINEIRLNKADIFSNKKIFTGFKDTKLTEINFNLKDMALSLKNIKINEPFFKDEISKNGSKAINSLSILQTNNTKKQNNKSDTKFVINAKNIEILNGSANIVQTFLDEPISHDIELKNARVLNFSNDPAKSFDIVANLSTSDSLSTNTNGKITLKPLDIQLDVKSEINDLTKLNTIINQYLNTKIDNGKIIANAKIRLNENFNINGNLSLSNFNLNDTNNTKIFSVKNTDIKDIFIDKDRLLLRQIVIDNPFIKAHLSKDKSLNLAKILKDGNKTEEKDNKTKNKSDFKIDINDIDIKNANINFSDDSLVLPFVFDIKNINTKVDKISNDTISKITSQGVVGSGGSANIDIKTNTFNPKSFSDINIKFKDIELTEVTPYSATFVGRKIDKGLLDLSLIYSIKDHKMIGKNDIVIDTIKLGESVNSKDAINLPLSLAISILQDSNNVIKLNLPVSGDLDNPKFSYSGIIFQAIMQVFTDVVTSPFRLLGNVLGIENPQELSAIDFIAGKDDIMSSQSTKISKLKEIADTKKDMIFIINPAYDENTDKFAIQKRLLDRDVAMSANTMGISEIEVLKEMASKKFKTPPTDLYKALVQNREFSISALDELAQQRANNLQKMLIQAGVAKEQIKLANKIQKVKAKMDLYVPIPIGIENKK